MRKIKILLICTIAACLVTTFLIGQAKGNITALEDELPEIHSISNVS